MTKLTQEEYRKLDAESAATFFQRCEFHHHQGIYDCGDKYVIYFTRSALLADLFLAYLPLEWATASELSDRGGGSAVIVYNYDRKISPGRIQVYLAQFGDALDRKWKDDQWILKHAQQIK